jgi:hypothetical protein
VNDPAPGPHLAGVILGGCGAGTMVVVSRTRRPAGSAIGVFSTGDDAVPALDLLRVAGFPADEVAVLGKGVRRTNQTQGWIASGPDAGPFGDWGSLWRALTGWLDPGFAWLPGIGWVTAAGWLTRTLSAGATLAALAEFAVPQRELVGYVGDIKAERYLVLVRGDASSVSRARAMLESTSPMRVSAWPPTSDRASEKAEALGLRDGLAS